MKLVLKDGAFVLLPEKSTDVRLLADLIGQLVTLHRTVFEQTGGGLAIQQLSALGAARAAAGLEQDGRVVISDGSVTA